MAKMINPGTMKMKNGFTLVELMIVIAVLAIIATVAVPNMSNMLDSNKLRGATSQFYSDTQYARSESITRNTNISVSVTSNGDANWCYGISISPGCDCTLTDPTDVSACTIPISGTNVLKVGTSSEFNNIRLISPAGTNQTVATFDPVRGIATTTGSVVFQSANDLLTHVDISVLGKISSCSPGGSNKLNGYSPC